MSHENGEVSDIDRLRPGGIDDEGDEAPLAEQANQVEDGAPKNYGDLEPDASLPSDE